ncbi:MAG: translation elongation factor Ts [Cucumibacter sp.]
MAIKAAQVKQLRELTGAGMMDCKAALEANSGNIETSIDWLKTRGLAKAAKKAGRIAAEGLIGVAAADRSGAVVEVNSETDFVARTGEFQELVRAIAKLALQHGKDAGTLGAAAYPGTGRTVAAEITEAVAKIGENMTLRRAARVTVDAGVVGSYVHAAASDGLGKIGVLVGLKTTGNAAAIAGLARQIAMHIAAASPLAVTPDGLDQDLLARERAVFAEQAKASGKPAEIVEKMVEGRLRKFYEDVCLLSQIFVIDGETRIEAVLKGAEKVAGAPVAITEFVRFAIGEGIEKQETDFAAEVAATARTA